MVGRLYYVISLGIEQAKIFTVKEDSLKRLIKAFKKTGSNASAHWSLGVTARRIFSNVTILIVAMIFISCASPQETVKDTSENRINLSIAQMLNGKWVSADNYPDGCAAKDEVGLRVITVKGDKLAIRQRFRFKNAAVERELWYKIINVEGSLISVQNKWGMSMRYRINSYESMTMIDKNSQKLELRRCK